MSDLDSLAFEPGQQVQCKTRFNDVFKGEVVAFDLNILDSISDVEILQEPHGECANDLPSIDMKYIKAKQTVALSERLRLVEAVGNGVSKDGISLFTTFSKMFDRASDVIWKDKVKIVVMNSVIISPPYKESDCEPINSKASDHMHAVGYVKSNVRKFWEQKIIK